MSNNIATQGTPLYLTVGSTVYLVTGWGSLGEPLGVSLTDDSAIHARKIPGYSDGTYSTTVED